MVGRPTRGVIFQFRCDDVEASRYRADARKRGMDMSQYFRSAASTFMTGCRNTVITPAEAEPGYIEDLRAVAPDQPLRGTAGYQKRMAAGMTVEQARAAERDEVEVFNERRADLGLPAVGEGGEAQYKKNSGPSAPDKRDEATSTTVGAKIRKGPPVPVLADGEAKQVTTSKMVAIVNMGPSLTVTGLNEPDGRDVKITVPTAAEMAQGRAALAEGDGIAGTDGVQEKLTGPKPRNYREEAAKGPIGPSLQAALDETDAQMLAAVVAGPVEKPEESKIVSRVSKDSDADNLLETPPCRHSAGTHRGRCVTCDAVVDLKAPPIAAKVPGPGEPGFVDPFEE